MNKSLLIIAYVGSELMTFLPLHSECRLPSYPDFLTFLLINLDSGGVLIDTRVRHPLLGTSPIWRATHFPNHNQLCVSTLTVR